MNISELGFQVKIHREHLKITQKDLADKIGEGVNRSNIAHLEQGRKIPFKPEILEKICIAIELPNEIWKPFTKEDSILRLNFEALLCELVGETVTSFGLDSTIILVIENKISSLFRCNHTTEQTLDSLNSILIYYGIKPISKYFFSAYLKKDAFRTLLTFESAIQNFLKEAIRLFSTISDAYIQMNTTDKIKFQSIRQALEKKSTENFSNRTEWDRIQNIPNEDLPFLGYIAADKVKKEENERKELAHFLLDIVAERGKSTYNLDKYTNKKKRRMDSLLRKFNSTIQNGLFSPLFNPDIQTLEKEAEFIAPSQGQNFDKMEQTQQVAYHNLSNYLAADYMDIYVATSMRSFADFVSVNNFVENLFKHQDIRQLKLRYFNPTQSWIEDRIAKGLVEALMLKRSDICIYMAQKEDTFGKDSEASVTLGQGKPVIVYVPKLFYPEKDIDSENFGLLERNQLIELIKKESKESSDEIDDQEDIEALHATLLHLKISKFDESDYRAIVVKHWADFDIESEFDKRIEKIELPRIKSWFDSILKNNPEPMDEKMKRNIEDLLVATAMRFERRAKIFREIHPLALQVILSTGVLNGILVVRSIDSCSLLVRALIENNLDLNLEVDDNNYKLIEKTTFSTIRVISKHKLLSNSFSTFYKSVL